MKVFHAETFEEWRLIARGCLSQSISPQNVRFETTARQKSLFADDGPSGDGQGRDVNLSRRHTSVPKAFLELAKRAACHSDENRFNLLYRVLWRLSNGEPSLLKVETDDDVHRLLMMEKAVRRDAHKMKAFVRFRKVMDEAGEHFIALHCPDHRIVRLTAPFFARRFPAMRWTIMTPTETVHWNLKELEYRDGVPASEAPAHDDLEELWKTYYANIFNPARIKMKMMVSEMPVRHWKTLPETDLIPELLANAPGRVEEMIAKTEGFSQTAVDFLPEIRDLDSMRSAAAQCTACDLHHNATQTVFGDGPVDASIMIVGEQPGDIEDQEGRPFVGPAGEVLARAMQSAGVARESVYVTNTVKHFKWEPRGKRRLHKKPDSREISACRPWVEAEIELVQPTVLLCLGATAAQSLIGRDFRITRQRGEIIDSEWCTQTIATWHPSAILRVPDGSRSETMREELIRDLKLAMSIAGR